MMAKVAGAYRQRLFSTMALSYNRNSIETAVTGISCITFLVRVANLYSLVKGTEKQYKLTILFIKKKQRIELSKS